MNEHTDIPDRPDLKQGGQGDERWIELDFYWEAYGFCVLLDQPERHSPYTRALDLDRERVLDEVGIAHLRLSASDLHTRPDAMKHAVRAMLLKRSPDHRVYRPESRAAAGISPSQPSVNTTRTLAWLRGEARAQALPTNWPCHYNRDIVTWNFNPPKGHLVAAVV